MTLSPSLVLVFSLSLSILPLLFSAGLGLPNSNWLDPTPYLRCVVQTAIDVLLLLWLGTVSNLFLTEHASSYSSARSSCHRHMSLLRLMTTSLRLSTHPPHSAFTSYTQYSVSGVDAVSTPSSSRSTRPSSSSFSSSIRRTSSSSSNRVSGVDAAAATTPASSSTESSTSARQTT